MLTKEEVKTLAREATYQSALISGSDIGNEDTDAFKLHLALMSGVLACQTKVLTHPLIFNMALCGSKESAKYRTSSRATTRLLIPEARFIRALMKVWWLGLPKRVGEIRTEPLEVRERFVWEQHDFLVSLEPFADANARTARLIYYMLLVALDMPIKIIHSDKAAAYSERQRLFRRDVFAPRMRAAGFIPA